MRTVLALVLLPALAFGTAASASCQPEPPPASTADAGVAAPLEMACPYTHAEDLPASIEGALIVDARPSVSGSEPRIPGSIPVSALTEASGHESALIVASGWNRQDERRACATVQSRNYKNVSVVRGGMRAWAKAGLPLWADVRGSDALDELSPADAHAAALRGDARLVVLPAGEMPILCPQSPSIHCVASIAQVVSRMQQCAAGETLIIAAQDADRALIARALPAESNVLRVAGGADAMRLHFEQFQSIAESASRTLWIPCHRR